MAMQDVLLRHRTVTRCLTHRTMKAGWQFVALAAVSVAVLLPTGTCLVICRQAFTVVGPSTPVPLASMVSRRTGGSSSASPPSSISMTALDRRQLLASPLTLLGSTTATAAAFPARASAAESSYSKADFTRLKRGLYQLEVLLDQWDEATLNCNYAEVNKDLLSSDNKQALLSAASESALFAKGTTTKNICKRDPEVVRKVMGLTDSIRGKNGPPAML